jgi:formamidopyrimidine-DNA glycosylase
VPEILEVESYRELAAHTVGATISRGWADAYLAKKLPSAGSWARAVKGLRITGTGRRGKLMWLETSGPSLGFRFGMTGVLLIDQQAGIDGLFYGPHHYQSKWVRGGLELSDGRKLIVHDPRRLARVEIEPDLSDLGPDVMTLKKKEFTRLFDVRGDGPALKARLLDQSVVAGIGNLLADEMMFRAGLDPRRNVNSLDADERQRLFRALTTTMKTLQRRGGSHLGDHMEARIPGGYCPKDGAAMLIATIGGRTTYWCSRHQK